MYLFEFLEKYYTKMLVPQVENLKHKTILISGANGLIGCNFVSYFYYLNKKFDYKIKIIAHSFSKPVYWLPRDESIVYLDSDLNQTNLDFEFDYLIHAATYGQPKKVLDNKIGTALLNTTTYIKLLDLARKNRAKVLFLSSSSIYGEAPKEFIPTPESYNGNLSTLNPSSLYAESKRMAEVISKAYIDDYQMDIKIARIAIAYGPGIKLDDKRFLNEFIKKALDNGEITMMDKGQAQRQVCFISDSLEMLLNIMLSGKEVVYNVSGEFTQESGSIFAMASLIARLTGAKVIAPKEDNGIVGAQNVAYIDIKKYCKEFGKTNFISLEEGFSASIEWVKILKGENK